MSKCRVNASVSKDTFLKKTIPIIIPPDTFITSKEITNVKEEQVFMQTSWLRKGLVCGIIVLCVGAGVVASQSGNDVIGSNDDTIESLDGATISNDLAILKIPSPHSGALEVWPVQVLVCNLGSNPESNVIVEVTIEKFAGCGTNTWIVEYDQTVTITNLNPCDPQIVLFPDWAPSDLGVSTNKCIKYHITAEIIVSDPRPQNDKKYEIFNLGDGNKITITVPPQSRTDYKFDIQIKNNLGVPACCVDYEIDLISYFPNILPPLVCTQTIGAISIPTGMTTTITVPVPVIPVSLIPSWFRIKITIADTKAAATGYTWHPGSGPALVKIP